VTLSMHILSSLKQPNCTFEEITARKRTQQRVCDTAAALSPNLQGVRRL